MQEVRARLVYREGADMWTRGVEHFYDMKEYTDYVARNKDRIIWATITRN